MNLPLDLSNGHFGSLHRLHLMSEWASGHFLPPGCAFCRIVRDRNRPPLLQMPRHGLHGDQGDSLQLVGLGVLTVGSTVSKGEIKL